MSMYLHEVAIGVDKRQEYNGVVTLLPVIVGSRVIRSVVVV